jgi:IS605 OrfB family transposase
LLHRLEQNGVPYRYEASYRALSKAERNDADPAFIGPLGVGYFKKVREDYYVPLTVMLLRDKKHPNRWQVRVSWLQPGPKSYETGNTFLSYDTNNDSLAYTLFRIEDGKLELLHTAEVFFEKQAPNGKDRERRLHEELNLMFDLALKHQACVVGEALNWEGAKTGFSAISKSLHKIPYRQIYDAVVRKGLLHGVPVRFINPAYTSVLGGLFTDLNRDKAAALVIGLKGSPQGIDLLETLCQKFLDQDLPNGGIRYKVEVKNRFSEIVKVKEAPSCQLDRQGATAASRLSYLLVDVLRHRQKLHRRLRHGEKLSTVVLLEDIGPTARPGKRRRPTIRRPKVKVEQELTIQS